jgi:hypothetical protein
MTFRRRLRYVAGPIPSVTRQVWWGAPTARKLALRMRESGALNARSLARAERFSNGVRRLLTKGRPTEIQCSFEVGDAIRRARFSYRYLAMANMRGTVRFVTRHKDERATKIPDPERDVLPCNRKIAASAMLANPTSSSLLNRQLSARQQRTCSPRRGRCLSMPRRNARDFRNQRGFDRCARERRGAGAISRSRGLPRKEQASRSN